MGGVPKIEGDNLNVHDAVVILNLPFSTLKHIMNKRSFDAALLSSPILIQIQWAQASNFMSTSTKGATGISVYPSGFEIANLVVRQDLLTDKSQSLRNTVMNSDVFAVYPYCHVLSGTQRTETLLVANKETSMIVDLTGFLNSDLLAISFSVNKNSHLNSVVDSMAEANNRPCNPGSTYRCKNIKLFYNGSTLFDLPGYLSDLHQCAVGVGDPHGVDKKIDKDGELVTGNALGNAHQYYLSFSSKMRNQFLERLSNTPRYSQQPIELRFDLEVPLPSDITNPGAQFVATFRSSYYYNSVNLMSKGNSNVFFT